MNELIKIQDAEFMTDELAEFLVAAKKACYAGNGNEQRLADGSKQLTFQQDNFHYTDNYAGYFQAPGTEIVRWQKPEGQRIWQMAYSGGMLPGFYNSELARETFDFLKKALSQVDVSAPFRGPECPKESAGLVIFQPSFKDGDFWYYAETNGNLNNFSGVERIRHQRHWDIFEQRYLGGLIIPK